MEKLLSIVIANYNYGRFLEDAIQSVVTQAGFEHCELIVIDGGSTDNSVDVIRKYERQIAYWVSEKDRGQSNAFNKGFSHARCKYLTWVNADDVLVKGSLKRIVRELREHSDCEWFTGNFLRFDVSGRVLEIGWGPHVYPRWMQHPHSPLVVFGPSTIFSKELWRRSGGLNEDLHFMMDTEMWMRFMKDGVKMRRIPAFVWAFRMHAESKTAEYDGHKMDSERARCFRAEAADTLARTGYRCSLILRILVWTLRCLDGSALRRFWYQMILQNVDRFVI